ncbi:MAG: hypothetical protein JEZ06_03935 [Anaerolineaceae bacterium]|nr:hypothetical protein [Anaerolineaceae bacterium]
MIIHIILSILCLLVPGLLSSVYHHQLKKIPFKSTGILINSFIYAFVINTFSLLVTLVMGAGERMLIDLFTSVSSTAKFAAIALVLAVCLPNIVLLFSRIQRGEKK